MENIGEVDDGDREANTVLSFARTAIMVASAISLACGGAVLVSYAEILTHNSVALTAIQTLGSFLLVGSTSSLIYRFLFSPIELSRSEGRIRQMFDKSLDRLANNVFRYGLNSIHPDMDFVGLFDGLGPGDELWWLDTYAPGHKAWQEKIRRAVERGATVKMLVLDPKSPMGELRAAEIGEFFTPQRFHDELAAFLQDMITCSKTKSSARGKMEVRTYMDLLGCPIYLVRSNGKSVKAIMSMYLGHATGTGFPHLVWGQATESLLHQFESYIQAKWDRASRPQ